MAKNILVYLDSRPESRAGLDLALLWARSSGARVRVMDVLRPLPLLASPGSIRDGELDFAGMDVPREMERERQRSLDEITEPLAAEGLLIERHVAWGNTFLELVREVIAHRHDLVIKTAEGSSPLRPSLFGTTAMHLVRKAPCPVWIAKAEGPVPPRRIVAAVDPLNTANGPLSEQIVETALGLAERFRARLLVVGTWTIPGGRVLRATLGRDGMDRYGTLLRQKAEEGLASLVARFGARADAVGVHVLPGVAENVIPDFVFRSGADLLVLGSVERGGIPGLLIGSVAEQILRAVDCSALALKPDGFISPVTLSDA